MPYLDAKRTCEKGKAMASMSMALSSTARAVNPFTRLYMLGFLPALAGLVWAQNYLIELGDVHRAGLFENNALIVVMAVLSAFVFQLPSAEARSRDWNSFWSILRVVYYVALAAAALFMLRNSGIALLGALGSGSALTYLAIMLAPWIGLPFLMNSERL